MKPLVEVFWTDHAFSEDDERLLKCRSVGFLLADTRKKVVIAQTRDEEGKYTDKLTVGRAMLRKVKRIR